MLRRQHEGSGHEPNTRAEGVVVEALERFTEHILERSFDVPVPHIKKEVGDRVSDFKGAMAEIV